MRCCKSCTPDSTALASASAAATSRNGPALATASGLPLGDFLVDGRFAGLRADDDDQNDQDRHDVGDDVEERVLARRFELFLALANHRNFLCMSNPLPSRAVCSSRHCCSACGSDVHDDLRLPVAVLHGQAPGFHFLLHAGDERIDFAAATGAAKSETAAAAGRRPARERSPGDRAARRPGSAVSRRCC